MSAYRGRTCALFAIAVASACSHSASVATLPQRAGEEVEVSLRDGRFVDARVELVPSGYELRASDGRVIPYEHIAEVTEPRRGRGLLEGLGLGVLAGGAAGAVIGFADGDDEPCTVSGHVCQSYTQETAGEKAVIGAVLLGMLGGIVGSIGGFAFGSHDVYDFRSESQHRIVPSGPPGSAVGIGITF